LFVIISQARSKSERFGATTEELLIITGAMGRGKTSVLGEASDILASRIILHAAVDLDALGVADLPSKLEGDGVMYRNLQSVCENYAALGVRRLLLSRALETRDELDLCRRATGAETVILVRLTASRKPWSGASLHVSQASSSNNS
jgi:hypothetical protein